jgi:hypothetical protein
MKVLPANRVAALAAFISGLAGCGTSLAAVWPSGVTNEIALIAGAVVTGAAPIAHIVGSIFWDRTPAGQAAASQPAPHGSGAGEHHKHDPHMSLGAPDDSLEQRVADVETRLDALQAAGQPAADAQAA